MVVSVVHDRSAGNLRTGAPAKVDQEYTMFLGDGPLGYTLNGKSFPATAPLAADRGDWVLLHLANDGSMLHPMHLHGYHFEVVAQDGFPLDQPYLADTLVVAPGQRFDVLVHATVPRSVGVPLPHPSARRGARGHVRDGDGARGVVTRRSGALQGDEGAHGRALVPAALDRRTTRRMPFTRLSRFARPMPARGWPTSKPEPSSSISSTASSPVRRSETRHVVAPA